MNTNSSRPAGTPPPDRQAAAFNIPKFWHIQQHDWKVTVVRTSLERLGYQMVYPYLSIFIIALGANKTQLGLFTAVGMVLAGLAGPYTGQIIDRTGPKKVYLVGIAMLLCAYLTYALTPAWQGAAVAMIVYYLGQGTGGHSCATICGNCLENCDRAKGMLICESLAAGLLGMIGPILSSWILVYGMGISGTPSDPDKLRPLFYVTAGITLLSFFVVATQLSSQKWASGTAGERRNSLRDGLKILKSDRNTVKWLVIGAITNLPAGMVLPFTQLYAAEQKQADVSTLAVMVTAAALTSVAFGYAAGVLSDKFGRKKVLFVTIPIFLLSNIILVLGHSRASLIVAGALQGFYYIGIPLAATIARELVPQKLMGRWLGVNRLVSSLFGALMAVVSGLIYDGIGPQYVFLIFVAVDLFIRLPLLASMPETLHYQVDESKFQLDD